MLSCRGGGQAVHASLSCPHPPGIKVKYFAKSTYFKLSEYQDLSIINIIQDKLSRFLFRMLSCRGGDKLSRPVYLAPTHLVSKLNYFANSSYFKLSECEDICFINII